MEYLEAKERLYSFVRNAKSVNDYQTKEWEMICSDYRIAKLRKEIKTDKINVGVCTLIFLVVIIISLTLL